MNFEKFLAGLCKIYEADAAPGYQDTRKAQHWMLVERMKEAGLDSGLDFKKLLYWISDSFPPKKGYPNVEEVLSKARAMKQDPDAIRPESEEGEYRCKFCKGLGGDMLEKPGKLITTEYFQPCRECAGRGWSTNRKNNYLSKWLPHAGQDKHSDTLEKIGLGGKA